MKQVNIVMTLLIGSLFLSTTVMAAKSEVVWTGYEDYQDVREGSYTREGFRELLTTHIEEHLTKLAAALPVEQTLKVNITDVDLAGDLKVASINDIRVMKNGYPPQFALSYQLTDTTGKVLDKDNVVIRDMDFMTRLPIKYRNKAFGYEKKMLDDWFKKTFKQHIVK